jgi:multiple sugar transport system ATP-binding protein
MKDGVVQQVDTPQNLYEKPQNLFVAGFMGSPQMNFLDATVKVEGDVANLVIANKSIPLPPAKSKKVIEGGNLRMLLGIAWRNRRRNKVEKTQNS